MRKKLFFITILLFILTLPANAVLQEDSLKTHSKYYAMN